MKRLLLLTGLLAALSAPAQLILQNGYWGSPITPQGVATCATTDTSLPHDTLLEGWQGATGKENTWSTNVDANVTLSPGVDTTALTSGKPTGACNQAVYVEHGAGTTCGTLYWDKGSNFTVASQPFNTTFWLYVTSFSSPGHIGFAGWNSTSDPTAIADDIHMTLSSGKLSLQGHGNTFSTAINISSNTWNKVTLHIDTVSTNCTLAVEGVGTNKFERVSSNLRYLHIGVTDSAGSADLFKAYVDVVCVEAL